MPPHATRWSRHITIRRCAAAWLFAAACTAPQDRPAAAREGARFDSSGTRSTVEAASTPGARAVGGSVAGGPSSADSAAALDRRFQAIRSIISATALSLDSLPASARFTAAYAARYDSLRRLTRQADSLRAVRDRLRKRRG